jgi:LysR family transcriptional regulator, hydrogen peroxide-inducible genes activator
VKTKLNFSLTQLEYVLAVYRTGHFAKAAEACHVTQPTLSMQIQKLEENLGTVLFDRSKKPVLLTETGKRVIETIQVVLADAKRLETLIDETQSDEIRGELRVGVIPTIAPYLLPRILPMIEKNHPELVLKIFELQTHRIVEALDSDEIDVGLLATPLNIPRIFEKFLFYDPFAILCRKDHELASNKKVKISSLKYSDIWLLSEGHCLRNQVLDVCTIKKSKNEKQRFSFESGSLETIKNLVDSYGGYSLLPLMASDHIGHRSKVIQIEGSIPAREIGLVHRREHYKERLIGAMVADILASTPDEIKKIKAKDLEVIPIE